MNTQEVELRAIVKDGNFKSLKDKLLFLGANSQGTRSIYDVYYCDKSCEKVEDAEMNKVGSFSIRIRKESKNGNSVITYNRKIITTEGDHNSWKEEEEVKEDFEDANQEMLNKGYKFFFSLDKEREKFVLDDMEICLEDIKDFGLGIEVEVLTTQDKANEAKLKIKDFLKKLELDESDIVPKSITNIIMHQRAFKN